MPMIFEGKQIPIKFNYQDVCTTKVDEISQYLEGVFNESNMSLGERRVWIEDLVESASMMCEHEFDCATPHMNLLAVAIWLLKKAENISAPEEET